MLAKSFTLLGIHLPLLYTLTAALPTNQKPLNDIEAFSQSVLKVRAEYVEQNPKCSIQHFLILSRLKKAEIIPTGNAIMFLV